MYAIGYINGYIYYILINIICSDMYYIYTYKLIYIPLNILDILKIFF